MRDTYTSIQPKISPNNFCSIELNPITSLKKLFLHNWAKIYWHWAHQPESEALPYLPLLIDLPSMVSAIATNSAATKDMNKTKFRLNCKPWSWMSRVLLLLFFFPCKALNLHPYMYHHPNSYNKTQSLKWWGKVMILKLQIWIDKTFDFFS